MTANPLHATPHAPGLLPAAGLTFLGALAGAAVGWWLRGEPEAPAPVAIEPPACTFDDDELKVVCLPYMRQTATTLQEAQTRVDGLAVQVRLKEVEVERLSSAVSATDDQSNALQRDYVTARSELDTLRAALEAAREAQHRLISELEAARTQLDSTQSELAERQVEVEHARRDALEQRWEAFSSFAQLEVCEQGNRGQVERCRELVGAALSRHESRFLDCVRSNQAVPELRLRKVREQLPSSAALLGGDDPLLRDWYILFCDPDLPEAPDRRPN